ncbi:MAG: zinc ABC transporter substrate-binding protein [Phycisphaerales bacterium]|nr:zinc ABC transporter substrate-binding protein [Phycisphaerales bacterium]
MTAALLLAAILAGTQGEDVTATVPPRVVASSALVADLVEAVGGGALEVVSLRGMDLDPHHWEPSPSDSRSIVSASATFAIGLGFDPQVAKLHAASGSTGKMIELGEGLGIPAVPDEGGHEGHDHGEPSEFDGHLWHDPTKVALMVDRIAAALGDLRPSQKEEFLRRASAYTKELATLDAWIKSQVATIPKERRILVTTHAGLAYFGARYGFTLVGVEVAAGPLGDADASPARLARLVEEVRATKSPVVFTDPAHPSKVEAVVAREAGVRLVDCVRIDSIAAPPKAAIGGVPARAAGDAYLSTMRANTACIVEALSP